MFHQGKVIEPIVIITYNIDLFESYTLGRMLFHQLLTEYYKDIGVAIRIKEFHHFKVINLIEMITFYFYLFVKLPTLNNI